MRKWLVIVCLAVAVIYLVSPILAAYQLRSAIVAGDSAKVRRLVDWASLRASVTHSISQRANLLPRRARAASSNRPSIFQRIRNSIGRSMRDRYVARYITPDGLIELHRARNKYGRRSRRHQALASKPPENSILKRITRIAFVSLTEFELHLRDRHKPTRVIACTFRLSHVTWHGFKWQLATAAFHNAEAIHPNTVPMNTVHQRREATGKRAVYRSPF